MYDLNKLHGALSAVCPTEGVAVGSWDDRGTWRIDYADGATDVQKAAAMALLTAFDFAVPTVEQVNAERDRRLRRFTFEGREYDYIDGKGSDQKIAKRGNLAAVAVMTGGVGWPDVFEWIAADNSKVPMTALQFLDFSKAAADWEDRIMHAARRLKDMSPIPADFADDSRW